MASKWNSILRFLFRRPEVERELDAELQYHVDRQTELNLQHGMQPAEARRQALISVGGIAPLKEECREARMGRTIEVLVQDVRYGLRVLRKNPGYACATILTLALGIGANTAIFSLIYGVFLRPLPYRDGGQLVVLHQNVKQSQKNDIGFSPLEVADYAEHNHTLNGVVEHHAMTFLLIGKDNAERVATSVVSVNFFDVLGVKPLLGRTFLPSDDNRTAAVLVLSYQYWQGHQGGDPNIVGKVFQMNNLPHTVIGVLPPIPQYPQEADVYMPTWQCPFRSNPRNIANRRFRLISHVFARLKPGVSVQQAQNDLAVVGGQVCSAHPETYPSGAGYQIVTDPLQYDLTHEANTTLFVLLAVSAFVLLVACANVANMMLARLLKLERELAVRTALGAGRLRLVRQLLTESALLSLAGGAVGLAVAPLTLRMLVGFASRFTPRANEVRIDAPVLLFTLLVSLGTGLLFGLLPALAPWKNMSDSLLHGARVSAGRGKQILRSSLVVAQVAVSFLLLIGAGLMIRSFQKMGAENPGFAPDHLLAMRISTGFSRYNDRASARNLRENISRKVGALGGVASVGWISNPPFAPAGIQAGPGNQDFEIEGQPASKGAALPTVDLTVADANYFQTARQPLVKGRYFTDHDDDKAMLVALINETMARHRWPNEDAVGKRISFDQQQHWITIAGVVGDTREYGLQHATLDEIYLPANQTGGAGSLVVRTSGNPEAMLQTIRAAVHEVDPLLAIDQVNTMARFEYDSLTPSRLMTILLAIFAGLAVLISASGIAAVMALTVTQRTHELGVRLALGARQGAIVGMVVRHGLTMALCGTLIGIAGAVALARLLSTLLYATSPTDVPTYAVVGLIFLAVAALACYIPARQVTTIDPLSALRQE